MMLYLYNSLHNLSAPHHFEPGSAGPSQVDTVN